MSNEPLSQNGDTLCDADTTSEFEVLQKVISALSPLAGEARRRILESASLFLKIEPRSRPLKQTFYPNDSNATAPTSRSPFSEDTSMSAKEFLLEKQPKTDVERIACLAYYLTHYRGTPHFKTVDLSMLNTEAAQPKFSNATVSSNNSLQMGYLAPSAKGQRQMSAAGERFVRALPDREAAKMALETIRRKPRTKRTRKDATNEDA
jgi:hypothetical protein